jgi:DNA-binding SARP family transcriptional activator
VRFRVFGPTEVEGYRPAQGERRVLTALLLRQGHLITTDELIDVVWGDNPPRSAANSLQSKISRLRKHVPEIVTQPMGYRLDIDRLATDVGCFESLCGEDTTSPAVDVARLDRALALWQGTPFADLEHHRMGESAAGRLLGVRVGALEQLMSSLVAAEQYVRAIAEGRRLTESDPYCDGIWESYLRALALDGRRVEALRAFQSYRSVLADEVGLDPAPSLVTLEGQIVRGEIGPAPNERHEPAKPLRTAERFPGEVRLRVPMAGREHALGELRRADASGLSGAGEIVVVDGAPGVGKSRLIREFLATRKRGPSTVGLGAYLPDGLLGMRTAQRAFEGLVPVALYRDEPSGDHDLRASADNWLADLADHLVEACTDRAHLAVLEDMHWADRRSVQLLSHLGSEMGRRRQLNLPCNLTVVVTVRPDSEHSVALARLAREAAAIDIGLRGLDHLDVFELARNALDTRPSLRLVDDLVECSGGNPLLILATVRRAASSGELFIESGEVVARSGLALAVPADVNHIVGRHLDVLPGECEATLQACALVGREAEVPVVLAVLDLDIDGLRSRLDEAVLAGIVTIDDDHVSFAHDLYWRVVIDKTPPSRREAMHRRAAAHLALATPHDDRTTVLIARHLASAGAGADRAQLAVAAERAGDLLLGESECAEAARLFDVSIDCTRDLIGVPRFASLLVRAGLAHFRNLDPNQAVARLGEAVAAARAESDLVSEGRAVLMLQRIRMTTSGLDPVDESDYHAFLATAGDDVPELRAEMLAQMAEFAFGKRRHDDGRRWAEASTRLSRELGLASLTTMTGLAEGVSLLGQLDLPMAERRLLGAWHDGDQNETWFRAAVANRIALGQLIAGGTQYGEWLDDAERLGTRSRNWSELSLTSALRAMAFVIEDEPDRAIAAAERGLGYYERSQYRFAPDILYPALAAAHVRNGAAGPAHAVAAGYQRVRGRPTVLGALVALELGEHEVARSLLADVVPPRQHRVDLMSYSVSVFVLSVSGVVTDPLVAEDERRFVRELMTHGVRYGLGWPIAIDRFAEQFDAL